MSSKSKIKPDPSELDASSNITSMEAEAEATGDTLAKGRRRFRKQLISETLKQREQRKQETSACGLKVAAKYIYNRKVGKCFDQNPADLLKIIVFHILFYGFLSGLTICLIFLHFRTLETEHLPNMPDYCGQNSFFQNNLIPLGSRPVNRNNRLSSLIWFNGNRSSWADYVQQLGEIVSVEAKNPDVYTYCRNLSRELTRTQSKTQGSKMCRVYDVRNDGDLSDWGPCTPGKNFGFSDGAPCILLKLNRVGIWTPQRLTNQPNMKTFIRNELGFSVDKIPVMEPGAERRILTQADRTICISCKGVTDFDREYIGPMNYYPSVSETHPTGPCLPLYYFPFLNQKHYLAPFVFVHFPNVARKVFIQIQCTAFNTAIKYALGAGTVNFELMID